MQWHLHFVIHPPHDGVCKCRDTQDTARNLLSKDRIIVKSHSFGFSEAERKTPAPSAWIHGSSLMYCFASKDILHSTGLHDLNPWPEKSKSKLMFPSMKYGILLQTEWNSLCLLKTLQDTQSVMFYVAKKECNWFKLYRKAFAINSQIISNKSEYSSKNLKVNSTVI